MKIKLFQLGKTNENYINTGILVYEKRLKHYSNFETITIENKKSITKLPIQIQKTEEGKLLLKQIKRSDFVILLDEKGKKHSSKSFANFLEKRISIGGKNVVFIIGGAYGFSKEIYERAELQIALSEMTFSHQMVRLIFIEQLYRAFTIIRNENYHH